MKSRIVKALGVAVVLVVLLTGVAAADQGGGTGTLVARGDGLAVLRGDIRVNLSGAGLLVVRDHAGDAKIHVTGNGYRKELANGTIAYIGFDGKAEISGSSITVALRGRNIKLEANGTGKFLLRGHGTYHTNRIEGEWSDRDGEIALD